MNKKFNLGRYFGINVYMHWTFIFILGYIAYYTYQETTNIKTIAKEVFFIFPIYLCVVLHEFGHALTAKSYGIKTDQIVLLPIGGVAQLNGNPSNAKQEFWITLNGPLVNVAIAIVLFLSLFAYTGNFETLLSLNFIMDNFFARLMIINIGLVVFNLIPAFPMDGGRIFRAALSSKINFYKATLIAARTGQVIALGFIIFGIYIQNYILPLISIFIITAAQNELKNSKIININRKYNLKDLLRTDYEIINSFDSIGDIVEKYPNCSCYLVMDNKDSNYINGIVSKSLLEEKILNIDKRSSYVGNVMDTEFDSIEINEPIIKTYQHMVAANLSYVSIMEDNKVVGIVSIQDLNTLIYSETKTSMKQDKIGTTATLLASLIRNKK